MTVLDPETESRVEKAIVAFLNRQPEPATVKMVYEGVRDYPKYKVGFAIEMLVFRGTLTSDARRGTLKVSQLAHC